MTTGKFSYVTCSLKPLASTCNSQLYNSYNSDVIFLKTKVMISEGFSKTILFIVILRQETWNCTAEELHYKTFMLVCLLFIDNF